MNRTKLNFNITIIYIEEKFNVRLPFTPGVYPLDVLVEILRIAKRGVGNPFRFQPLTIFIHWCSTGGHYVERKLQ